MNEPVALSDLPCGYPHRLELAYVRPHQAILMLRLGHP